MEETSGIDIPKFLMDYIDYAVPKMDVYEQTLYMYIFRHGRLLGNDVVTIGFRTKLQESALGLSNRGSTIADSVIYARLRALAAKNFITILATKNSGTEIRLFLPDEIPNLIIRKIDTKSIAIEDMDFFVSPYRELIVHRENNKCFYCFKSVTEGSYVIEHVVSRPEGNNSYKNLVLSCRSCNNRKSDMNANDFLRMLYRENIISEGEFASRITELERLQKGELIPDLSLLANYAKDKYV